MVTKHGGRGGAEVVMHGGKCERMRELGASIESVSGVGRRSGVTIGGINVSGRVQVVMVRSVVRRGRVPVMI